MTIERENGGPVLAMIIELLLTWRIGVKILLTRLWLHMSPPQGYGLATWKKKL